MHRSIVSIGFCLGLAPLAAAAADVDALPFFQAAAPDADVVIQAGPEDAVVFREDASYVLEGRNLILSAGRVRSEGHPVVRSFAEGSRPPDFTEPAPPAADGSRSLNGDEDGNPCRPHACKAGPGDAGPPGAPGAGGRAAGRYLIDVGTIEGGSLTILGRGQEGGLGQTGGRGGNGGPGGRGHDRNGCNAFCGGCNPPGNGGEGGDAGPGGPGGPGGRGGVGADIQVSLASLDAMRSGKLTLDVAGGPSGPSGTSGDPGQPGSGNDGGHGNACGGGGVGKGKGQPNVSLPALAPIGPGAPGQITCFDCSPGTDPLAPLRSASLLLLEPGATGEILLTRDRPKLVDMRAGTITALCFGGVVFKEDKIVFEPFPGWRTVIPGFGRRPEVRLEATAVDKACPAWSTADDDAIPIRYEGSSERRIVLALPEDAAVPIDAVCTLYRICP